MINISVFFLILSTLVLIHELGHFLVAKKSGILVEEFGFGLPPRIWGRKIGETVYSVNLLPFGGFVRLLGEEERREHGRLSEKTRKRAFFAQPGSVRALVVAAGVIMNFLLAILVFGVVYSITGIPTPQGYVEIVGVLEGSPADEAGLKEGDVVKNFQFPISNFQIKSNEGFVELVNKHLGEEVGLEIERQGLPLSVAVVPRKEPPKGEGALGVVIADMKMEHYPFWQMPFLGVWWGFKEAVSWGLLVLASLWLMLRELFLEGRLAEGVGGPVAIYGVTKAAAQAGWLNVAQFLGILSVNLGVINFLPFPALDGGRLIFLGLEKVLGKKVDARYERWTHTVGLAILLALMVLVTFRDIQRLVSGGV